MLGADLPFFQKSWSYLGWLHKPRGWEIFSSGRAKKPALISILPKKVSNNCTFTNNGKAVRKHYITASHALATSLIKFMDGKRFHMI
jgi:hypothetical protein